nr:MAG TPA: hypothetical protein [Caudoviricetes sp.]
MVLILILCVLPECTGLEVAILILINPQVLTPLV